MRPAMRKGEKVSIWIQGWCRAADLMTDLLSCLGRVASRPPASANTGAAHTCARCSWGQYMALVYGARRQRRAGGSAPAGSGGGRGGGGGAGRCDGLARGAVSGRIREYRPKESRPGAEGGVHEKHGVGREEGRRRGGKEVRWRGVSQCVFTLPQSRRRRRNPRARITRAGRSASSPAAPGL